LTLILYYAVLRVIPTIHLLLWGSRALEDLTFLARSVAFVSTTNMNERLYRECYTESWR
jgi:hypothetical protein